MLFYHHLHLTEEHQFFTSATPRFGSIHHLGGGGPAGRSRRCRGSGQSFANADVSGPPPQGDPKNNDRDLISEVCTEYRVVRKTSTSPGLSCKPLDCVSQATALT